MVLAPELVVLETKTPVVKRHWQWIADHPSFKCVLVGDHVTALPEESIAKKDGFCALRYAHHLLWLPKWNDGIEAFHNFEILPEVDEWEKFLAKADVGFAIKLIYDFDLLAKIEWEFNSMPAGTRKKDDVRYIVGLGYKW